MKHSIYAFLVSTVFFVVSLSGMEQKVKAEESVRVCSCDKKLVNFLQKTIEQSSVLYEQYLEKKRGPQKKNILQVAGVGLSDLVFYRDIKELPVDLSTLTMDQQKLLTVVGSKMGDSLLIQQLTDSFLPHEIIDQHITPHIIAPVVEYAKHTLILHNLYHQKTNVIPFSYKDAVYDVRNKYYTTFACQNGGIVESVLEAIKSIQPWVWLKERSDELSADINRKQCPEERVNCLLNENRSVLVTWPIYNPNYCLLWVIRENEKKEVDVSFVREIKWRQGGDINSVHLSRTGDYIAIILTSGRLVLIDRLTGKNSIERICVVNPSFFAPRIVFSSDEKLLCIAGLLHHYRGQSYGIKIFDIKTKHDMRLLLHDLKHQLGALSFTDNDCSLIALKLPCARSTDDNADKDNAIRIELLSVDDHSFFEGLKKEKCTLLQAYNLYRAAKASEITDDKQDKRHILLVSVLRSFITDPALKKSINKIKS